MKRLRRFNLTCEEILADMNMLKKIVDKDGIEAEDIEWKDFYKLPTEEYKYASLMKKIDEETYEAYVQFEVPSAVRNLEVPEDRLHMVKDIVSKVAGNEEYEVEFSKILAPKAFTILETPVENFYPTGKLPWSVEQPVEEPENNEEF